MLEIGCHWTELIDLRAHVTTNVERGTDPLEGRETLNLVELGVVGDLEVAVDLLEHGEGEVGQLLVGNEGKGLADAGQVGGREALEAVVVETEGAVEGLERGHRDGTAEAESHVGGPDEVGQTDLDVLVVVGKGERVGNVAELHIDFVDEAVVGNEDGFDLLDVHTLEGAESGVLDVDLVGLLDLSGEAKVEEVGEGVPLDRGDGLELGEVDREELGGTVELHLAVEGFELAGAEALHLGVVLDDEVALERLDAVEGDVVGGAGGDGDAAGVGRARGQSGGIALVLNGGGGRGAAGS
jgi:hypothetical protein